jgi:K+-transporting ATPase ATPase C chain
MKTFIRPLLVMFIGLSILTGLVYPYLVTGIAQAVYPAKAAGSLIVQDGKPVGSTLIGQNFSNPGHFWGRPSATGPQPNNGIASSGSNLGPLNPALVEAVKSRVEALRSVDPSNMSPVPVDLVTASASGLDPHISAAAARYQMARVAQARNIPVDKVATLVDRWTQAPVLALLGEPVVNVLQLNMALETLH